MHEYCEMIIIIQILVQHIKGMSHNIDQNSMLKYVCLCFQMWGITYISRDILKKSKDNSPECCQPLTRLLFDLAILQILQHQYTITSLGIQIHLCDQFIQEFVLSYLSQACCPFLESQAHPEHHSLDFDQSSSLLNIVGWLMAKTDFFGKIRTKLIPNKFSDLYITKKSSYKKVNRKQKVSLNIDNNNPSKGYQNLDSTIQRVQRMYKTLNQHHLRIQCLQRKKSQIFIKLNKQISHYNKSNQTNIRIQNILKVDNQQQDVSAEENELQSIISEGLKGMKNQQYFWMWLQYKVIDPSFKQLQNQFPDQFEKVEAPQRIQWVKMNPQYLSKYDKLYKHISQRMEQFNQFFSAIQPEIPTKPIKDQSSIRKQIFHDAQKMLKQQNPEYITSLGIPCFLKLEVIKYCQKRGFGAKSRKNKKNYKNDIDEQKGNKNQSQLKQNIKVFIDSLDQIKFI